MHAAVATTTHFTMPPSPIESDTFSDDVVSAANNSYVFSQSLAPVSQAAVADSSEGKLVEEQNQLAQALFSSLGQEKIDPIKQQLATASVLPEVASLSDSGTIDEALSQFYTYKLEYHLNLGKIIGSKPLVLASQTLTNSSDVEQEMSFTLNKSETHTSKFEYSAGMTIGSSVTVKGKSQDLESCGHCLYDDSL